jgi:phosphatidylglycerophosphate synthase
MIDRELRRLKDHVYQPVAVRTAGLCSPTIITLTAGAVGVMAAFAAWQGSFTVGLLLWWLNRVLDGLDGAVARAARQTSDFGGYLDMMVDYVVYLVVPCGIVLHAPDVPHLIALAFMLGTFYINNGAHLYLSSILERRRQGAQSNGELTTITMPRSLIEGFETIIVYSLFFLLPELLMTLFALFGLAVLGSTTLHLRWAARHL